MALPFSRTIKVARSINAVRRSAYGARPSGSQLRRKSGIERIEAMRPDLTGGGKAWRVALLLLGLIIAGVLHEVALSAESFASGWGWIAVAAATFVLFRKAVFRASLALTNTPYLKHIARQARPKRGPTFSEGPWGYTDRIARTLFTSIIVALTLVAMFVQAGQFDALREVARVLWWIAAALSIVTARLITRKYLSAFEDYYDLLAEYGVESITPVPGIEAHVEPILEVRLAASFGERDLPNLQKLAESKGCTITDYDLVGFVRTAEFTPVTDDERKVYEDIARSHGKPVFAYWIGFKWTVNDEPDRDLHPRRIETLTFYRYPVGGLFDTDREKYWRSAIAAAPKGSNGWTITDDQSDPIKVLRYGKQRELPESFASERTLPDRYRSAHEILASRAWARVPLGVNPSGRIESLDLAAVPHTLFGGGTNSGKSTAIIQDMIARRARGHMLAVFDNSAKKGGDFLFLKPFTFMFCTSASETANGLTLLYREVHRRSRFLMETYRINNWLDTDDYEGLIAAGITPLTLYYDEYETSVEHDKEPKHLPEGHPDRVRVHNRNVAIDTIEARMLNLAREGRAVGVFLVVATQKPLLSALGTLRSQLGNSMQLVAGKMSSTDVSLTMGTATTKAMEQIDAFHQPVRDASGQLVLDDAGKQVYKPGLGILLTNGGEPEALRVGYVSKQDSPRLLTGLEIPESAPWELPDVLGLDLENDPDRFIDAHDTRPRVAPPFSVDPEAQAGSEYSTARPNIFDRFRD